MNRNVKKLHDEIHTKKRNANYSNGTNYESDNTTDYTGLKY